MLDFDWLIIGAGLHGRFIAASITTASPRVRLAVVDPETGLSVWHRRTTSCGMSFLRSSMSHHLGQRADSLRRFATEHRYGPDHLLGRYRRPSLALFNHHASTALGSPEQFHTSARKLVRESYGWRALLDNGLEVTATHVVVATGAGNPFRPPGLHDAEHIFDDDFTLGYSPETVAIVGGGISAGQLALRALDAGHEVHLLTRHCFKVASFDSDPCYAGPRCLGPFATQPIAGQTHLLAEARLPGSVTPGLFSALAERLDNGSLEWRTGTATDLTEAGIRLADGQHIKADRVILATGFEPWPRPDGLLARTIHDFNLPMDDAWHLHVDANLAVAQGLHVAGRPASLQLGPMAGNIKGARTAGRILSALAHHETVQASAKTA